MRPVYLAALSCSMLFSSGQSMGVYDQDWITRVRLPLAMMKNIFELLDFDPLAPQHKSESLYKQLVAYETFQPFAALPGFGYAF
jgi:hypothetical protein